MAGEETLKSAHIIPININTKCEKIEIPRIIVSCRKQSKQQQNVKNRPIRNQEKVKTTKILDSRKQWH